MASGAAGDVITRWIIRKIYASRNPVAVRDTTTGRFDLPYGTFYRWTIILLFVASAAFLVLGLAGTAGDLKATLIVGGIFGALWAAVALAVWDLRFVTIRFGEDGIWKSSATRPEVFVPWSSVTAVKYSESMKWFVFRSDTSTIRVSVARDGLGTFAQVASSRLHGPAATGWSAAAAKAADPFS